MGLSNQKFIRFLGNDNKNKFDNWQGTVTSYEDTPAAGTVNLVCTRVELDENGNEITVLCNYPNASTKTMNAVSRYCIPNNPDECIAPYSEDWPDSLNPSNTPTSDGVVYTYAEVKTLGYFAE